MNINDVEKDQSFHAWKDFEPNEVQYAKYDKDHPSTIAAAHKIQDFYLAFCRARFSLLESSRCSFSGFGGNVSENK